MIKVLLAFLFILQPISFAADNFLEFGNVNFGRDFKEKSKWNFKLGSETIRYKATVPEYTGEHIDINGDETDDINGYGLSFGRDFYLGAGVSTAISISAYYSKTLDKIVGKGAKDIDIDFAETRTSYLYTAYEGSISLNYLFDYKVVDVQPFIEFGGGTGQNIIEKQYTRRGFPFPDETEGSEEYDVKVTEKFAYTRLSLGVNFISYKGLMSYIRVSTIPLVISERETSGETNVKGTATYINVDNSESGLSESQTLTMVSLGIGSYF